MNISLHIRYPSLLLICLSVFISCDKPGNSVGDDSDDNLLILSATEIIESKNGLIVNGQSVFTFPNPDSMLLFRESDEYRYMSSLGIPDSLNPQRDFSVHTASIHASLNKTPVIDRSRPLSPTNPYVFDYVDLGDLMVNGINIDQLTETRESIAGGIPDSLINFTNFTVYNETVYAELIPTGVTVNSLLRNAFLTGISNSISSNGSAQVSDFNSSITYNGAPEVVSITEGKKTELQFEEFKPQIRYGADVTIQFSKELKADGTYILINTVPPNWDDVKPAQRKFVFISIIKDTDRIIIPASAFTEMKEALDAGTYEFQLRVVSHEFLGNVDLTGTGSLNIPDLPAYRFHDFTLLFEFAFAID